MNLLKSMFNSYYPDEQYDEDNIKINQPKIIWCSEEINSKNYEDDIRKLRNFAEILVTQEDVLACLRNNPHGSYTIITSIQSDLNLLQEIFYKPIIGKIFILLQNDNKPSLPDWMNKFEYKVEYIINDFGKVITYIQDLTKLITRYVLWCDPNINQGQNIKYVKSLQQNYVFKRITTIDSAIKYLKFAKMPHHVIVDESFGEKFVKQIYEMNSVVYIYIFCKKISEYSIEWIYNYKDKLVCVQDLFYKLIEAIAQKTNYKKKLKMSVLSDQDGIENLVNEEIKIEEQDKGSGEKKKSKETKGEEEEKEVRKIKEKTLDKTIKSNKEKHKIIWVDKNILENNNKDKIKLIQEIGNLIQFTNEYDAINYIKNNIEPYYIIVSGSLGQPLLKEIYDLRHVIYIYIYCYNINYHSEWSRIYKPKVICVENQFKNIYSKLKQNIEMLSSYSIEQNPNRNLELSQFYGIFNDNDIIEVKGFNRFVNDLIKINDKSQAKNEFLEFGKKMGYPNIDKDYEYYNQEKMLDWYIEKPSFSKLINNSLISADQEAIIRCRLPIISLDSLIKTKYKYQNDLMNLCGVVYSATIINNDDWKNFTKNIGKDIQIKGFLRAHQSKQIGYNIIQDSDRVLLTIIIPDAKDKLGKQGFVKINNLNKDNQSESNFIFNIQSKFQLMNSKIELFDGKEYKNLILIYGAFELKKYMLIHSPILNIKPLDSNKKFCSECNQNLDLESKDYPWFLDLRTQIDSICLNCYQTSCSSKNRLDLMIYQRKPLLNNDNKIDQFSQLNGYIIDHIPISLLGIYCSRCGIIQPTTFLKCLKCKSNNIWCLKCIESTKNCQSKNEHFIISQSNNVQFWSDALIANEYELWNS